MRPKRVRVPGKNAAGKGSAHRPRWWGLALASAVSAALGAAVTGTVTTHGSISAEGEPSRAQPAGTPSPTPTPSRPLAALGTGVVAPSVKPYLNPKQLKAVPVGPADVSKPVKMILTSPTVTTALDASGIPTVAVKAYQRAAAVVAVSDAACHLPWQLLAGIGRVESDNGQFGGAMLLSDGYGTQPIYGLPLDGRNGVALIRDTDGGKLDGDPNFDRAVGPMQFIPSTWAVWGADGNGDGKKDPNNIFDAALGAAHYLCAGGGDLANPAQETAAVLTYNDADEYAHVVIALATSYEQGDFATVPTTAPAGSGGGGFTPATPTLPPAEAPAPTKIPIQSASKTPTPQPTPPSSPATAPAPSATPTATPTQSPSAGPTTPTESPSAGPTTTPPIAAPTHTTGPKPEPSGLPGPSGLPVPGPVPSVAPTSHSGQCVDIGWAPAMRQVVVKLLSGEKATPIHHGRPKHHGTQPTAPSAYATRRTTAPRSR